jgi:hypothetical protein
MEANVSNRLPGCWCMADNSRGTLRVGVSAEAVRDHPAVLGIISAYYTATHGICTCISTIAAASCSGLHLIGPVLML